MYYKLLNRKRIDPKAHDFTGVRHLEETSAQLFSYNKDSCSEDPNFALDGFKGFQDAKNEYWLNIHGIHDTTKIQYVCTKLNIHDLAIQDILDVNQRAKFQSFDDYYFFTLKSIIPSEGDIIEQEQLSFIMGKNYLVSFQERKADYFDHIRERLRKNIGTVRERSIDYLLYLLLESILDNYFKTLDDIEDNIEKMEILEIDKDPSPLLVKWVEQYKRQIHHIKKKIIPIKEFVTRIEHEDFNFIHEKHIKYFYELKDLCLSLLDDSERLAVRLESNINLFFSIQGHRMNQVMKTLTVITAVFIPLTFIAGIYGMNFSNMPELQWYYGYFAVIGLMATVSIVLIIYFKKKKWY